MKRKVLLVGGAGYIGSVLTHHLLSNGYDVRCFDLLLYGNGPCVLPYLNHSNYEFVKGDLCNLADSRKALSGVTDVIMLAGLVGDPITKKYPEESEKINSLGLTQFIHSLNGLGLNRVVFISTCSNYGLAPDDGLVDENSELRPLSLYAKAKVALEKEVMAQKGKADYTGVVLRFATAFGLSPRMRFDLTVNEFTQQMYLKKDLLVFDADTWRPYCHVKDFSRALQTVLEAPKDKVAFDVFNVGGDKNNYTKKMIVNEILKLLPESPVRYQENGSDPRNYRVNFEKIRSRLGFEVQYFVPDGIQETILALKNDLFADYDSRRDFYGNYTISY
jgi:nucleoside-diphosphate-sugar epimerase